ncbi:Smad nuclear-interacting protein 1 FHA domain-containing protein SNIP1 [Collichthys lucidus]|uniref:Smad nuclear-interacting protein 1 FHA domain-containing protein SNIP1 n=1 Tax=Collichthys lucidus TaxID=240159 RepID=A0A4U5V469_COLLU|nr:Smad nuclear-interacting protein 1 FHA domain-containing protein SNIP1 [Collichthys lucidus]TKS82389.1 Smad nuclear-interacting protein 1 FHA domain-containing protein SNIP1 [Collichthys lucidus]
MTKEKRHRRRESPERESKVKVKQEKLSPLRPQTSRRSRSRSSGNSSPPRRRTSRSPARTRDRSPARRETSPARRGSRSPRNRRSPHRGADVKIKRERDEHRPSGDERRRRNDQPEERRSRWESDRPRERDRGGDRHRERNALASQQAERQQHDERRRENRQRREENQEQNFGGSEGGIDDPNDPPAEKEKPNFGLSGALTEDTNTFRGVVIKYNEPPEARIPKRRWRLYPFKNDEPLPVMYIHRQSAYLLGRQRKIADIPIDHPSCSKQHAVFQYRLVEFTRKDGTSGRRVRPYIIDLGSGNGTYLNNQRIDAQRYYELKEKDVIKFGFSSREYVLLHEFSDTTEVDAKQVEEEDDEGLDE